MCLLRQYLPLFRRAHSTLARECLIGDVSLKNMRTVISFLLVATIAFAGPVKMDVGKGDVAIAYDPTQPNEKISIVWLSYCIGRLHYFVQHRGEYPKKITGTLVPKFREEVEGRFTGLDTYKNMLGKKFEADAYWADVKAVSEAGFLDEYVWTYFFRDSWPLSEKPMKISEFTIWKKDHLSSHTPATYGALTSKKG